MKTLFGLALAALLAGLPAAYGQTVLAASSSAPPPGSALPPPGIDDPGETPRAVPLPSTGIRPSVAPAARAEQSAAGGATDANGDTSNVAVRTNANGDRVEEYRRGGQLYMVRITPKNGVTQTFMVNSTDGSLMRDPKLGPVAPVYYTIYRWDGPRKQPASASTSGR